MMLTNILVWIVFTIFIAWLSTMKTRHFLKERKYKNYVKKFTTLKNKPTITKSLDDKMDYVRTKTEGGKDILPQIISIIIFFSTYILLIHKHIPTFSAGIIIVLLASIILSWIVSRIQFSGIIFELKFITTFIGYWYIMMLMIFIKFLYLPNIWIMIIGSIILMVAANKVVGRMYAS